VERWRTAEGLVSQLDFALPYIHQPGQAAVPETGVRSHDDARSHAVGCTCTCCCLLILVRMHVRCGRYAVSVCVRRCTADHRTHDTLSA